MPSDGRSDMMFQDKMYQIVCDLFEGTASGAVKWQETAEEDSFRAVLSNSIVRVERHPDPYASAAGGGSANNDGAAFSTAKGIQRLRRLHILAAGVGQQKQGYRPVCSGQR